MNHDSGDIRILHVDDEPSFVELAADMLERENDRFVVKTATNAQDGLTKLATTDFDCIVSDYVMPNMDGISFLQEVRQEDPDLPFILFTGEGSEEIASEAISAGVTDYLQKETGNDQYTILSNRILNAVEKYHAQINYQEIFEKVPDGLTLHDPEDGTLIDANEGFCNLLNYDRDELIGKDLNSLHVNKPPYTETRAKELIQQTVEDGPQTFEWMDVTKDGDEIPVEVHLRQTVINGQERILAAVRDISERRQQEKSLQRERSRIDALIDIIPHPLVHVEFDENDLIIQNVNEPFENTFGYSEDDLIGTSFDDQLVPDRFQSEATDLTQRAREKDIVNKEVTRQTASGERDFLLSTIRFANGDDIDEGIGMYIDITDRKRRLDTILSIVDKLPSGILVESPTGEVLTVNEAFCNIFDISQPTDVTTKPNEEAFQLIATKTENGDEFLQTRTDIRNRNEPVYNETMDLTSGRTLSWSYIPIQLPAGQGTLWVYKDISAYKQREQELQNTNRQLQAVLDTVEAAIFIKDTEGRYQLMNEECREILGIDSTENITGKTDFDLFPEEVAKEYRQNDQKVLSTGETLEIESEVPTKEGTTTYLTFKSPLGDPSDPTGICGVATDITERKQREEELSRQQSLLEAQQEAILDGIVVVNENHELVSYNDQFVEMLGIPQEIIEHEGTESVLEWMAEKLDNPQEFRERTEHLFKHPEKTQRGEISFNDGRVFEEYTTSIMGEDGSYYGRLWMFRNITQQKERERELQQSHELINALSTTFPDYTFIYNENGTYLDVITGWDEGPSLYTKDEIIGKSIDDLLSSDTASQIRDAIQTTLETGNLQTLEYTLETPGGVYWYEGHLAPLPEGYEGEPAVVLSARDITDRKEYEQELERQNNRLERFASVVSHDLRNPLNLATGRLALAKEECSSDQLQKVEQALKRMDALIDDTLTLARQGRTIDETTPVPLEDVVDTAWRTASTNNATLSVENNLGTIEGDTNRIKELLENLFRNAAKHGGNDVTVQFGTTDHGFFVADDGPGIPDEKQDEIFEHGYTTSDEGTGFGLSIVEEITNAHGWDISVTTSPSGGAQFEITSVEFIEES